MSSLSARKKRSASSKRSDNSEKNPSEITEG